MSESNTTIAKKDFSIVRQVRQIVGDDYSDWGIGRKPDPWKHKHQKGHPLTWLQWKAHSSASAKEIERFFLEKGMRTTGEKHHFARYIFLFQ